MARTIRRRPGPPTTIALPPLTAFGDASLQPHGDYEAADFVDCDFADQRAGGASFLGCRFRECGLDGVEMPRSHVSECVLEDCHALSVDVNESTWRESLVSGGRYGALRAAASSWMDVRLRGCKFDFADLSGARLTNVVFEDCVFGGLDLGDAQLTDVRLDGCSVAELTVEGAKLAKVDLSRSVLGVVIGVGGLRGAIIGRDQLLDLAPLLAAHVGLEVRTD